MTSIGLGSCVGLVLHDESRKIGGLAHVMLPNRWENQEKDLEKFADTAVEVLLKELIQKGCKSDTLKAKSQEGLQCLRISLETSISVRGMLKAFVSS